MRIAFILVSGFIIQQLKEYSEKLAQALMAFQAERNKKWVKYLVQEVPRQIIKLHGLADVTLKMAEEAFEIFCSIKPEQKQWVIP